MKKTILLVVLLTLVAFISGAIATAPPKAATTPAPAAPATTAPVKLEKFTGDIKSVDAVAKSIVVVKGKESKTFIVDDKTKITKGKDALTFADLKAGMNVVLEYKKDGDKLIAVTIKVSAPKAPPKGK
jgi:Cu/Ag efflux protein CusF